MRNKITGLAAAGAALITLMLSAGAFGQAVPVPFNTVIAGTTTADAGSFATLSVLGTSSFSGSTMTTGTVTGDAGSVVSLEVEHVAGGTNNVCVAGYPAASQLSGIGWGGCSANALNTAYPLLGYNTQSGGVEIYNPVVPDAGLIYLNSGNTVTLKSSSAGIAVGNSGSNLTNLGIGTCTLSSGQCNAVVPGAQGNSSCFANVQGTSQTLVGCDARADAGSATAFCQSTAAGTASIFCIN